MSKTPEEWEEDLDYGAGRLRDPDKDVNTVIIRAAMAEARAEALKEAIEIVEGLCEEVRGDSIASQALRAYNTAWCAAAFAIKRKLAGGDK